MVLLIFDLVIAVVNTICFITAHSLMGYANLIVGCFCFISFGYGLHSAANKRNKKKKNVASKTDCAINNMTGCVKNCSTCKNNEEFPPPHACDICTSLDQNEEYSMWETKA